MKLMFKIFGFFFMLIVDLTHASAKILPVGPGKTYANIELAAKDAKPGDSILIYNAVYTGPYSIPNLKGTASAWIYILAAPNNTNVIFSGGAQAFHLMDPAYVHIEGLTIQGQTANGVNIDDAGTFDTPAKHVRIVRCTFRDINATGNNDLLKLSGLDSFEILGCQFINGSAGGSGIDMVGCHSGLFQGNFFNKQGSNSIQCKGGTQFITIRGNKFVDGGTRALNLGGGTGLAFFRPQNATFEAADMDVYANFFSGSEAPIAFVGCTRVSVCNNTIVDPGKWVLRILQETVDPNRFISCSYNTFCNNIIRIQPNVTIEVNIGPNTLPGTFTFSNNLWWKNGQSTWQGPVLPVNESARIIADPKFVDTIDYKIQFDSPAKAKGINYIGIGNDFFNVPYKNPPSIGYHEVQMVSSSQHDNLNKLDIPFGVTSDFLIIKNLFPNYEIKIYNLNGVLVFDEIQQFESTEIYIGNFIPGIYLIQIILDKQPLAFEKFIKF
ncbi:MAG: right-handed parallel beta-helix repeat-containing protein [Bacteroidota bacterium]|nr:right-handed parallel beta-helix repeat-containing protein [Bacteroidota bacterium]